MKQGNYEHRLVTHLDDSLQVKLERMLRHYKTTNSEFTREMVDRFHDEIFIPEIKENSSVVQFELFSNTQD